MKPSALALLLAPKSKPDAPAEGDGPEMDYPGALRDAFDALREALKTGDRDAGAEALHAAVMACEGMPHDEASPGEGPQEG